MERFSICLGSVSVVESESPWDARKAKYGSCLVHLIRNGHARMGTGRKGKRPFYGR